MKRDKLAHAIELTTERFILRPIAPFSFARQTFHWTRDRESLANLAWRTEGWTFARWWRHLRKFSRRHRMSHGIWPRDGSRPIGLHYLILDGKSGNATIGVFIAERDWWGKGVVGEVRAAIIEDGFERLGMHRVTGWVNSRNFASIFNYQALGFAREAMLRESMFLVDRTRADQIGFGLLRTEWRSAGKKGGRETSGEDAA